MALSADELVKQEIFDELGTLQKYRIRIFMQSSNKDQDLFSDGGLTFGVKGTKYGSCDAAWELPKPWTDPFDGKTYNQTPVVALEATDALNRRSTGNAQYQRFHHALGAVRGGSVGFYYLRPGLDDIRPELYGMANFATRMESGSYFVTDDLEQIRKLLETDFGTAAWESEILSLAEKQEKLFDDWFKATYGDWGRFAKKRSTIIKPGYVIKHAGRMLRNFTDSSQRAGHIAVGEMFLTKYFFGLSNLVYYLFPRMKRADFEFLDPQIQQNYKDTVSLPCSVKMMSRCVYVCIYICVCVYIYIHVYVFMYVCMYVCLFVYMYVYTKTLCRCHAQSR
jgi:hypothetical protein